MFKRNILNQQSYTLIEILIVIGVVAVLATVTTLIINPAVILANTRDVTRLSDLKTINEAIKYTRLEQVEYGSSSVLYISIPDHNATTTAGTNCDGMSLPLIPSGWSYHCPASSTVKKIDGSGWLPINFSKLNNYPTLSLLPVDPINTLSNNYYYTYATENSRWHLTAMLGSDKYLVQSAKDGGYDPEAYEQGTDLAISPFARGLIGFWKYEGNLNDSSRMGNNATGNGTYAYVPGQNGQAVDFNRIPNSWASAPDSESLDVTGPLTIDTWVQADELLSNSGHELVSKWAFWGDNNDDVSYSLWIWDDNTLPNHLPNLAVSETGIYSESTQFDLLGVTPMTTGKWYHLAGVYDGQTISIYLDGKLEARTAGPASIHNSASLLYLWGNAFPGDQSFFNGKMDETRIFRRALSPKIIEEIYNNRI